MNMRVKKPVVVAADFSGSRPGPGGRRLAQVSVVPLADGVSALAFDTDGLPPRDGARLNGEIAGRQLSRPIVSTRLPLRRGGLRHVLLVAQDAERLAAAPCRLALGPALVAELDPSWLQTPLVSAFELIDGLSVDGRRRLLKMLLTTAGSLYGAGRTAGYGAAVRRLVELLAVAELRPASLCALGTSARLISYRMPPTAPSPQIDALVALAEDRASRIPGFGALVEPMARGVLLHLFVPGGPGDRTLVAIGPDPLILACPSELGPQPLAPWLARRPEATRAWVEGLVGALTETDSTAAALLREIGQVAAPPPELVLRHLSAAPRGALVLADLVDPHRLVAAVRVDCGAGAQDLDARTRVARPGGRAAIGGFLELAGVRAGASCRIRLVYGSGRVQTLRDVTLTALTGKIPEGFVDLDLSTAAAALAAARFAPKRRDAPGLVEAIGAQPARPRLSLVAPAGANPDLLRARAASLFAEPGNASVEVIYHTGAAEEGTARRALSHCASVFGLGCRLLILPDDADPTERLRAALHATRSAAILLVGADILPAPGWLAAWSAALARPRSPVLLGGTLLSPEGAVRDAGGGLALDAAGGPARLDRRWTGLPSSDLPTAPSAPTHLVSASCVGLNRHAVAALLQAAGHDPDPDVLLVALAARLRRRRGAVRTLLGARFVHFGEAPGADPLGQAVAAHAIAARLRACANEGSAS